ncbi:MAG: hypothetical protein AB7I30_04230 [Isosphaeraceae bacterium]
MRARFKGIGVLGALVVLAVSAQTASACLLCHSTPCTFSAPKPAYECVTEYVPYTVMKKHIRIDWQPVTKTVMEKVPHTTWEDRQRVVCKKVYDTQYVQKQRVVCKKVYDTQYVQKQRVICKPVYDTQYVTQTYTTCRPETSVQQVLETCMQPYSQVVTLPAKHKFLDLCHKTPECPRTAIQTCYTPVQVAKNVTVTRMVPETQTRQVPVTSCRMVQEVVTENVPVTSCRWVQEVVTENVPVTSCRWVQEVVVDRVPHTTYTCEPRQVTKHIPVPVCETVPVTKYKKVKSMVPVACAAPVTYDAPLAAPQGPTPAPQSFGGASGQG